MFEPWYVELARLSKAYQARVIVCASVMI